MLCLQSACAGTLVRFIEKNGMHLREGDRELTEVIHDKERYRHWMGEKAGGDLGQIVFL